jgi:hypothetical protein
MRALLLLISSLFFVAAACVCGTAHAEGNVALKSGKRYTTSGNLNGTQCTGAGTSAAAAAGTFVSCVNSAPGARYKTNIYGADYWQKTVYTSAVTGESTGGGSGTFTYSLTARVTFECAQSNPCSGYGLPNMDGTVGGQPGSWVLSEVCPDNSTQSGQTCTCDAGWKPGPGALACVSSCDPLKLVSSGYYDIGKNPNADPKLVACAGLCQVVFDGYSPAASAMVGGEKHWFSKGQYNNTGATCTPSKQETAQIGIGTADKPEDTCPPGQTKGSINDKMVCYKAGEEGDEQAPPDKTDKTSKTTTKNTVTNPDGSVTVTETTTETDSEGRESVTTIKTTTKPDGTVTTETSKSGTPTGTPDAKDKENKTCGGAGQPACTMKIDEEGTATQEQGHGAFGDATNIMGDGIESIVTVINGSGDRTSLPWSPSSLLLPHGGCTPQITETRLGPLKFDPCNSPIVLLWRQLMAWLVYMLTLLYGWRSAIGATGGEGK